MPTRFAKLHPRRQGNQRDRAAFTASFANIISPLRKSASMRTVLPSATRTLLLRQQLLGHVLAADFDLAFVLAGLRKIIGKLHP